MRIALFTDSFGISQFESSKLIKDQKVACLIVASNRPKGHGAARRFCIENSILFLEQPKYKSEFYNQFVSDLARLNPDTILSSSYSMIIREEVLKLVNGNAFNIHWSSLPKNRGPNPIQWTLIKDEKDISVTLHKMTVGIDEGPIVYQEKIHISDEDTWLTLFDKLTYISDRLVKNDLEVFLSQEIYCQPQNDKLSSVNSRLTPDSPEISIDTMNEREIFNLIRAQIKPLKGAYIKIGDMKIRFPNYIKLSEISDLKKRIQNKEIELLIKNFGGELT